MCTAANASSSSIFFYTAAKLPYRQQAAMAELFLFYSWEMVIVKETRPP